MTTTLQISSEIVPAGLSFTELLDYRAQHQPHDLAYRYLRRGEVPDGQMDYQTLRARARAVAAHLRSLNITGGRALLLFSPGLDFVTAFLGCLYAGVTAVPAYPPRKNQKLLRLLSIVDDSAATAVLTTADLADKIGKWFDESSPLADIPWLSVDVITEDVPADAHFWDRNATPSSLAFLQYTSGSTGTPKGVMVTQENLLHNLAAIHRCFGHSADSKGVIWLPPYHDMGLIGGILQPLYGGFEVTLMSPVDFLQKPLRWLRAVSDYRGTTSGGPDFAYDLCARKAQILLSREENPAPLKGLDLSSWQVAFTGAEPIRADTLARFGEVFEPYGFSSEAFYPCYGMAETTLIVSGGEIAAKPTIKHVDAQKLGQHQVEAVGEADKNKKNDFGFVTVVGCGQSLQDQRVKIVHPETLTCCSSGEVGEIWVQGESVAKGYWRKPEETSQTFQAYTADTFAGPFLRTGDLGFLEGQELFVTGRMKDVMIIRGQNYYPQDIERTLETAHAALKVGAIAAFSIEHKGKERLVIVSEVARSHVRKLDVVAVSGCVRRAIAAAHDLQVYATLLVKPGSIPKTSSGKLQRYRCRDLFLSGELAIVKDWSESPTHKSEFVKIQSEVDSILKTIERKNKS